MKEIEMTPVRVTIGQLRSALEIAKMKGVSDATSILWADIVEPGSKLVTEVPPKTLLLGLEWMENGEINRGTLRVEPPSLTGMVN